MSSATPPGRSPERKYLDELTARLGGILGDELRGVYAVGSLALGAYRPGSSDLDVLAVVSAPLGEEAKRAVARDCRHEALPCPARKLELVVISAAAARRAGAPQWELNLNTGERVAEHIGLDPAAEPAHWFVLDLALAHDRGIALSGPPARELLAPPAPAAVAVAQAEAIAFYAANDDPEGALLAACRAWHWRETGRFAGKHEAFSWAATRLLAPPARAPRR